MDINRNQWFLIGFVVLLLGIQFRLVDSFVLTSDATKFLAERTGHPIAALNNAAQSFLPSANGVPPKKVIPPEWVGWCLGSIGSVLILHSWGMKKPE